jgi:asparagine synthase (glutamine-hydrolysing)
MCGIAGLTFERGGHADPGVLNCAMQRLAHRGPDDQGWLTFGREGVRRGRAAPEPAAVDVALLHRRLSIIDLSSGGWQPMSTPDDRFHIIQNGEIYNYLELRAELERRGVRFRSSSDTEVLLAAYATWGADLLPRLVGMFAFAVLDVAERRLFLARDFFGIKPLYYARWQHGIAFASEIKALLAIPGVRREVHPQALYDYLRFGLTDHGPDTLFAAIRQVPPGHYLEVALDAATEPEPRRYWALPQRNLSGIGFD